jgi:hypothetical protein
MGESLTERRRVKDEASWGVNFFCHGMKPWRISAYKLRASPVNLFTVGWGA